MDSKNLQEKEHENRQVIINKQEVVNEQVQATNHSIWESQFKDSSQLSEERKNYAEVEKNRNVWKYEKKRKKAAQSLHDAQGRDELRKEKFLKPSVEMLNRVDKQLDSLKEGNVTKLFELSACMDNCVKTNEQEADVDLDKVITSEDFQSQDYKTLSDMFKELKKEDALLITSEKLDQLLEKYNSLNLKIQAPCSKYLKDETHENVSFKPGELLEPSSGYFIIYNCVLTALKNCVDQLDESNVNIEEFSKLCGLEASSSLVASAICNNAEFKTKRDDAIANKVKQVIKNINMGNYTT